MKNYVSTKLSLAMLIGLLSVFLMLGDRAFAQLTGQIPVPGNTVPKYVESLPHFAGSRVDGTQSLTISMEEFQQKVLPASFYTALPTPYNAGTYVWGYKISDGTNIFGPNYPTFTIETHKGTPTTVTYVNNLQQHDGNPPILQQYLWIDQTLHWADPFMQMGLLTPYSGPAPAVVHLHGGEVPSEFDGGPDAWFTPGDENNRIVGPAWSLGVSDVYTYPNDQEAATIWFHDHTLGATRINVYAGLAGYYFIRDKNSFDTGIPATGGLPTDPCEIEIAIQDRMFDTNGQLFFPNLGINPEHPFWVPEFFGDIIVVNGKTWPYLQVEPRRYRFRVLNGSNARFYNLTLGSKKPSLWQIGTDGGLLDAPVKIAFPTRLLLAPGERADVIVDFSGYAGQTLTLTNDAKAPFPNGAPADPQTVGQIMQFRVVLPLSSTDNSYNPATGAPLRASAPIVRIVNETPDVRRQLTLNEVMGMGGPLEVLVNNTKWHGKRPDGTPIPGSQQVGDNYMTEVPVVGATELWEIINLTADAHPIHLHLTQFQLVNRQRINTNKYNKAYNAAFPGGIFDPAYGRPLNYFTGTPGILGGNPNVTPYLQGSPQPPLPNEAGWKDTFVMYPGEVTRVMVRYAPQDVVLNGAAPETNLYSFDPSSGPGYVWHCHIIDHEDNEMMRPYSVTLTSSAPKVASEDILAESIPLNFTLEQNFPNPFNPSTEIRFNLPADEKVQLKIYNTLGQLVKILVNAPYEAGQHSVTWNATDETGSLVPSGIYFYRISAGNYSQTRRMLLVR